MAQLKLSPSTNVLSIGAARVVRGAANSQAYDNLSVATQPSLPLTLQRLELIKALAKETLRSAEDPIAQRHDPPRQPITAPSDRPVGSQARPNQILLVLPRQIRTLVTVLIFVALLPNLTLAAILWLRVADRPASMPATLSSNQSPMAVQSAVAAPVLSAPSMLKARAGETVPFPVALDGTDGVPARSIIVISGLPHGSRLSSGSPYGETEWNLKPDEIGDVQLVLPNTTGNETNLLIQLVAPNGGVLAATTTILKLTAGAANIPVYPVKTQLIQGQVWDEPNLDAMDEDERPVNLDAATASSGEIVPLPTRRPTPIASGNVNANWVESSAFVNLRKGPTSSASVVGVVAKGTKLRLVGRKRGWVEVTNPATSETGWIYARNVDPAR
jgi:hypothetical protein